MKTQALKGMRDLLPAEQTLRDYIQGKILETYRSAGFERISTPMLEDMENLDKSDGGDNLNLIFKVLKRGDKLDAALAAGDVASYDLRTVYENMVSDIPLFNLISVLEGYLVNEFAETSNSVSGKVQIAIPKSYSDGTVLSPDSILICGDQPEVIKTALEAQVGCLIICQADIAPELTEIAGHTCIISTPLDARQAARLIYQAVPVMRLCQTRDIVCFHLSDYIDDVKETLLSSRYRCYPVLDENEKVVGTLGRRVISPSSPAVKLVVTIGAS